MGLLPFAVVTWAIERVWPAHGLIGFGAGVLAAIPAAAVGIWFIGFTPAERRENRKLSGVRVGVEHAIAGAKRSRITKDTLRNTRGDVSDAAIEVASALHNLRVQNRKRRLKR